MKRTLYHPLTKKSRMPLEFHCLKTIWMAIAQQVNQQHPAIKAGVGFEASADSQVCAVLDSRFFTPGVEKKSS